MALLLDITKSYALTQTINKIQKFEPFALNMAFKKRKFHPESTIKLTQKERGAGLALFIQGAGQEPHNVGKAKRTLATIELPETGEKKVFTVKELEEYEELKKHFQDQLNDWVADELSDLKERVMRRREWMACAGLVSGGFTTQDIDGAANITVEYGFTSGALTNGHHIITLTGDKKWSDANADILKNIREYKSATMDKCGKPVDICFLGAAAADAFLNSVSLKDNLHNQNNRVGQLDQTQSPQIGGNYLGSIGGVKFYEYHQTYKIGDTKYNLIPDNKAVFFVSNGSNNILHTAAKSYMKENGALAKAGSDIFVKPVVDPKNDIMEWRVYNLSLPVIHDPDEILSVTVV